MTSSLGWKRRLTLLFHLLLLTKSYGSCTCTIHPPSRLPPLNQHSLNVMISITRGNAISSIVDINTNAYPAHKTTPTLSMDHSQALVHILGLAANKQIHNLSCRGNLPNQARPIEPPMHSNFDLDSIAASPVRVCELNKLLSITHLAWWLWNCCRVLLMVLSFVMKDLVLPLIVIISNPWLAYILKLLN